LMGFNWFPITTRMIEETNISKKLGADTTRWVLIKTNNNRTYPNTNKTKDDAFLYILI
jgi:hypothetical protein